MRSPVSEGGLSGQLPRARKSVRGMMSTNRYYIENLHGLYAVVDRFRPSDVDWITNDLVAAQDRLADLIEADAQKIARPNLDRDEPLA